MAYLKLKSDQHADLFFAGATTITFAIGVKAFTKALVRQHHIHHHLLIEFSSSIIYAPFIL